MSAYWHIADVLLMAKNVRYRVQIGLSEMIFRAGKLSSGTVCDQLG